MTLTGVPLQMNLARPQGGDLSRGRGFPPARPSLLSPAATTGDAVNCVRP